MKLCDVIRDLQDLDDSYVIRAPDKPRWGPDSPAGLVWVEEFADPASDSPIPGYFLEVFIAKEVLTVWSEWRGGRQPSLEEKCEAVIFYARHDAYIPLAVRP